MKYLETAILAAQEAGKILLALQQQPDLNFEEKEDHYSLVTKADLQAEKVIMKIIQDNFPAHSILSEETESKISGDWVWVIDPLDGTSGYLRGFQNYSVSIALLHGQTPVLGVVYNPVRNELFHAQRGEGAFLNRTPIHVSRINNLHRAVVTISHTDLRMFATSEQFSRLYFDVNLVQILNSCALELAYVACGHTDVLIQANQALWDISAGGLILQEAGGRMMDFQGFPLFYKVNKNFRCHIVATNGKLGARIMPFIQPGNPVSPSVLPQFLPSQI